MKTKKQKSIVGWREWVAFPELGVNAIKAKLDTGARTSSLYAGDIEPFTENGIQKVRFTVHPVQGNTEVEISCEADIIDTRQITNSGGHRELRHLIETNILIQGNEWPIKLSLASRDTMRFRLLLGRTAMRGRLLVDSSRSFVTGKELRKYYKNNKPGKASSGEKR